MDCKSRLPKTARSTWKKLALTSKPEEDRGLYLSGVTLAVRAAYTIINPSYSEIIGTYNKLSPPIIIGYAET